MNNSLGYIDDYFAGRLTSAEKKVFENQCEADPAFAEEVAFMISVRDGLKQELYAQKKKQFDDLYKELSNPNKETTISIFRRTAPYIAAACLVILVALIFLFKQPSPQSLANSYINENFNTLGATMGNADSLQMGIAAYNNKDYKEAERIFKTLVGKPDVSDKALASLGIVYMVTEKYSEAVQQFDALSQQNLHANPGLFYKALVLLKRNKGDDKVNAKRILQEVIQKDLPGRSEAQVWIKNL